LNGLPYIEEKKHFRQKFKIKIKQKKGKNEGRKKRFKRAKRKKTALFHFSNDDTAHKCASATLLAEHNSIRNKIEKENSDS